MNIENDYQLKIVVIREDDLYVAQCVSLDIAAHGDTAATAVEAFGKLIVHHIVLASRLNKMLFEDVPPAPPEYGTLWEQKRREGHRAEPLQIPAFQLSKESGGIAARQVGGEVLIAA